MHVVIGDTVPPPSQSVRMDKHVNRIPECVRAWDLDRDCFARLATGSLGSWVCLGLECWLIWGSPVEKLWGHSVCVCGAVGRYVLGVVGGLLF